MGQRDNWDYFWITTFGNAQKLLKIKVIPDSITGTHLKISKFKLVTVFHKKDPEFVIIILTMTYEIFKKFKKTKILHVFQQNEHHFC